MDITEVEVLHDHVVRLRFADGVEKTMDLEPYCTGRCSRDPERARQRSLP